jgi:hypothetical protein
MTSRLHLLLIPAMFLMAWIAISSTPGKSQRAFAQTPSGSSRSDSSGHDRERDRSRSRYGDGDRGRSDWRGSRSRSDEERRGDERRGEERSGSSGSSSTKSSNSGSSSQSTSSSSSVPSTSTSTSSASTSASPDLRKWATALVTKNDKNGNMILEPEEQAALGSSAAAEDLNHDGKITIDEIIMHHSPGAVAVNAPVASGSSTTTAGGDSGRSGERDREHSRGGGFGHRAGDPAGDSRSKVDDAAKRVLTGAAGGSKDDKRHSYRFSKATDKLPTGLPSWFKSRDRNGDGQVSMSEYSSSVTQSSVDDFRRYDANDDGIITAKEAAKQK